MQAQEIMTKDVVTVSPDTNTSQIARRLLEHKISAVPVIDSSGIVIGMVSDVTAQKTAEASLHQRDQELQRLAGQLIEAQEEERRRASRRSNKCNRGSASKGTE